MDVVLLPINAMPLVVGAARSSRTSATRRRRTTRCSPARRPSFLSLPIDAEAFARTGIGVGCSAGRRRSHDLRAARHEHLPRRHGEGPRAPDQGRHVQPGADRALAEVDEDQLQAQAAAAARSSTSASSSTALYGPDHPYTKTGVADARGGRQDRQATRSTSSATSTTRAGNATLVDRRRLRSEAGRDARSAAASATGHRGHKRQAGATRRRTSAPGRSYIGVDRQGRPAGQRRRSLPGARRRSTARRRRAACSTEMLNDRDVGHPRSSSARRTASTRGATRRLGPIGRTELGGTVDAERAGESIKAMRDGLDALRKGDRLRRRLRARAPQGDPAACSASRR